MVDIKSIYEKKDSLTALDGFLFFALIPAVSLFFRGELGLWKFSAIVGFLLLFSFVSAHAKSAMGMGDDRTENTEKEQSEDNEQEQ